MAKKFIKKAAEEVEEPKKQVEDAEDIAEAEEPEKQEETEVVEKATPPEDEVEETEEAEKQESDSKSKAADETASDTESPDSTDDEESEAQTQSSNTAASVEDEPEVVDPSQPQRHFNFRNKLGFFRSKKGLGLAILAAVIVVGASGVYFYSQNSTPEKMAAGKTKDSVKLLDKIGKLIELPTTEEPIIATVSDVNKLPKQDFYDKAQNGDRVLVYKDSKMAILYRPSQNKIIKVGTVTVEGSASAAASGSAVAGATDKDASEKPESSPTPTPGVLKVVIYNGTKTAGLAKKTGDSLTSKFNNIEISSTANATADYTKSLIVDLSGKNSSAAKSLAGELLGEVGELPESESQPSGADILVILGNQE